jgi:L,D-transpeptidase catalytic domain/Ankyrin repeats (3 copies)
MKAILSRKRRTLVCLVFCLAGPFTAGPSTDFLSASDSAVTMAFVVPPPIPSLPFATDAQTEAQLEEERRVAAARQVEEERLRRMNFFEAIAGNDGDTLCKMLNEGMDPNAEFPLPVPVEFQKRFTDERLRYYLSNEKGFTALMFATALGNHAFVKVLLDAGADRWKVTKKHKTHALWLAAKYKNIEIMRSLMGIGPNHESHAFRITISLSEQKALLWRNGKVELVTPISSGRRSTPTPRGRYLVTNKYRYWKSTLYPAEMPFFLRLSCGDFGLHMGRLPGYPASHGCVRLPERAARRLYASVPIGTLVEIQ